MAKRAKCDKCQIKWNILIKDHAPLRILACNQCGGTVTPIYSPCQYTLAPGEPVYSPPRSNIKKQYKGTVGED